MADGLTVFPVSKFPIPTGFFLFFFTVKIWGLLWIVENYVFKHWLYTASLLLHWNERERKVWLTPASLFVWLILVVCVFSIWTKAFDWFPSRLLRACLCYMNFSAQNSPRKVSVSGLLSGVCFERLCAQWMPRDSKLIQINSTLCHGRLRSRHKSSAGDCYLWLTIYTSRQRNSIQMWAIFATAVGNIRYSCRWY